MSIQNKLNVLASKYIAIRREIELLWFWHNKSKYSTKHTQTKLCRKKLRCALQLRTSIKKNLLFLLYFIKPRPIKIPILQEEFLSANCKVVILIAVLLKIVSGTLRVTRQVSAKTFWRLQCLYCRLRLFSTFISCYFYA